MTRLGGKQDLSHCQILVRRRHRREASKMRGMPTPPGTRPREFRPTGNPWWKPSWYGLVPTIAPGRGWRSWGMPFLHHRHTGQILKISV